MPNSGAARWISEGIDWPKTSSTPWRFSEAAKSCAADRLAGADRPESFACPFMVSSQSARPAWRLLTWKTKFRNDLTQRAAVLLGSDRFHPVDPAQGREHDRPEQGDDESEAAAGQ